MDDQDIRRYSSIPGLFTVELRALCTIRPEYSSRKYSRRPAIGRGSASTPWRGSLTERASRG